jgi:hypothetical protein
MSSPGASATKRAEGLLQWNLAYGFRRLSPVLASWPTTFPTTYTSSQKHRKSKGIINLEKEGDGDFASAEPR